MVGKRMKTANTLLLFHIIFLLFIFFPLKQASKQTKKQFPVSFLPVLKWCHSDSKCSQGVSIYVGLVRNVFLTISLQVETYRAGKCLSVGLVCSEIVSLKRDCWWAFKVLAWLSLAIFLWSKLALIRAVFLCRVNNSLKQLLISSALFCSCFSCLDTSFRNKEQKENIQAEESESKEKETDGDCNWKINERPHFTKLI